MEIFLCLLCLGQIKTGTQIREINFYTVNKYCKYFNKLYVSRIISIFYSVKFCAVKNCLTKQFRKAWISELDIVGKVAKVTSGVTWYRWRHSHSTPQNTTFPDPANKILTPKVQHGTFAFERNKISKRLAWQQKSSLVDREEYRYGWNCCYSKHVCAQTWTQVHGKWIRRYEKGEIWFEPAGEHVRTLGTLFNELHNFPRPHTKTCSTLTPKIYEKMKSGPISVAARSLARFCGRSLAGIAGSNLGTHFR